MINTSLFKKISRKSYITLTTTSLAFAGQYAWAVPGDININTSETSAQTFTNSDSTLTIQNGGDLTVNTSTEAAVNTPGGGGALTGLTIVVDSGDNFKGIAATNANHGAIEATGNDVIHTININSGLVTSNRLNGATISLAGGGTVNMLQPDEINLASGATISNIASGTGAASAIDISSGNVISHTITILDGGSVKTNGLNTNSSAIAINFNNTNTGGTGTIFEISNTGVISGGTSGTAIRATNSTTNSNDFVNIINEGNNAIVNGDIYVNAFSSVVAVENGAVMNGDILGTTAGNANNIYIGGATLNGNIIAEGGSVHANLDGSVINGNIDLSNGDLNSDFDVIGGTLNGNVILNNNNLTRLRGLSPILHPIAINGTINGAGRIHVSDSGYTMLDDFGTGTKTNEVALFDDGDLNMASHSINTDDVFINTTTTLSTGTGTLTGDVHVNGGTLDLTAAPATIVGDIAGNGAGTIKFGQHTHSDTGTFTATAGDTISTEISTYSSAGRLVSTGLATIDADSNLDVGVDYTQNTYNSGRSYNIVTGSAGSSGTITQVSDANISVNGVTGANSNRSGVLNYHTRQDGNNLVLYVEKDPASSVTSNASEQNAYEGLDAVGINATNELKDIQNYIMTSNATTASLRTAALESITPNDTGINKTTFDSVVSSARLTENRLEEIRNLKRVQMRYGNELAQNDATLQYAVAKKEDTQLAATPTAYSTQPLRNKNVWIQTFTTGAKQDNERGFRGYDADTVGLAVGIDKNIKETKVSRITVGTSLSYAQSDIKASTGMKRTDIDSYQLNFYAGQACKKYFMDAVVGFAFNQYDSKRSMITAETAKADYNGQTYMAKIKGGFVEKLGNNFELIPETSLAYVHNHIGSYSEKGAGTANLDVNVEDARFLEGRVGVGLGYNALAYKSGKVYPMLKISYGRDFIGNRQNATSNFTGQNVFVDTQSSRINRNSLQLEGSVYVYDSRDISVSANYVYERKSAFDSHSGLLRLSYNF